MGRSENPFWRFSLRTYARSGVEQACLALQGAGADVNLLLYCCWQGHLGNVLGKPALRKAMATVAAWQAQVVQPLRQARRIVKLGRPEIPAELGDRLRKEIMRAELSAEYLEQLMLAGAAVRRRSVGEPALAGMANLETYLELAGIPCTEAVAPHLRALLGAPIDAQRGRAESPLP